MSNVKTCSSKFSGSFYLNKKAPPRTDVQRRGEIIKRAFARSSLLLGPYARRPLKAILPARRTLGEHFTKLIFSPQFSPANQAWLDFRLFIKEHYYLL